VHLVGGGGNFDGLGRTADLLEGDGNGRRLVDQELNPRDRGFREAWSLGSDLVRSGSHLRNGVAPLTIGGRGPLRAGVQVGNGDGCIWNHGSRRIRDSSGEVCCLTEQRGGQQKREKEKPEKLTHNPLSML